MRICRIEAGTVESLWTGWTIAPEVHFFFHERNFPR